MNCPQLKAVSAEHGARCQGTTTEDRGGGRRRAIRAVTTICYFALLVRRQIQLAQQKRRC